MKNKAPFIVYNASAGSGKTFMLVSSFLIKILTSQQKDYYKHLLAITFTNKAVAEMKQRVINSLINFSLTDCPKESESLFQFTINETGLSEEEIRLRAQRILKHVLNHYSLFSVETIDHFNLRLLRTFARDLKLPPNFEVSLETPQLILKAIDKLIEKAGEDIEITNLLVAFALQKTEEDKSWDIAIDLNKAAKLLILENDLPFIESLKTKTIADFKKLQNQLQKKIKENESQTISIAEELLATFSSEGLGRSHFSRGYVFDFFSKITDGNLEIKPDPAWYLNIDNKELYKAKEDPIITAKIDAIVPIIKQNFERIRNLFFENKLHQNILRNLVPLATVNLINQELQVIKEEEGVLPISEFNRIISNEIKNEPAPYIYERLGERYRHFFVDEFQDTSLLQWQNLIPLVDNALAQNYVENHSGSLLLVGDAKQSIYRWRGGLPEQFIDLCYSINPFPSVEKEVKNLQVNYRSCETIIDFNNRFFSFMAPYLGDDSYQKIYEDGSTQLTNNNCEGFVSLNFIEASLKEEAYEEYVQKVYETILDLEHRGCPKKDICILTRKKEEGVAISEFLVANNIHVVSEETLLLQNSKIVQFLISLLQLSLYPKQDDIKINVLEFLFQHLKINEEKHTFFSEFIGSPLFNLEENLKGHGINIQFEALALLSVYESFEYFIHCFQLDKHADTYLIHFMDWVFQFSQNHKTGKKEFLDYWETEKEKASLSLGTTQEDSVQIMTIHKSKGLEFPVVIFPFADIDIYYEKEPKAWYPWQEDGFESLLINYNKQVENYSDMGAFLTQLRRNTLEFDNINLLYVAFTRAEKELHVFAKDETIKNEPKKHNQFLKLFLQNEAIWEADKSSYSYGKKFIWPEKKKPEKNTPSPLNYTATLPFQNLLKITNIHKSFLAEEVIKSIDFGNLIHDTMAKIHFEEETEYVLEELQQNLTEESFRSVSNIIQNIVTHPKLNELFSNKDIIYNERDIISKYGVLRPDRINIHPNNAVTLLDYKTGGQNSSHMEQIESYANVLKEMGFSIKEKLIVYIQNEGILINNI